MPVRTVYCVQTYKVVGRELAPGALLQFTCATEAEEAGERLKANAAGVAVFYVQGQPEYDVWEEPVMLARHGRQPAAA